MRLDSAIALPAGVNLIPLKSHADGRGDLTEIFRNEWFESSSPVQWQVTRTEANALRGVHAHARHWDYYCLVAGEMVVGLHDLRPGSSSALTAMLRMSGERLQLLAVPIGVAHGLYSPTPSTLMVGTSTYYDSADHRGCRWNDSELGLKWPCTSPVLSAKDRDAGSYAELKAGLLADLAVPSASV
jgi:dTDP-4-dehydrorhamnose 3,5-epimerase